MEVRDVAPPKEDEFNEFYRGYVSHVIPAEFSVMFGNQCEALEQQLSQVTEERASQLDEPYTWTLKQVVGHLIDAERIFVTRALRIGAGDTTPIPGMDQDIYVANLDYESVTLTALVQELVWERRANIMLLNRFADSHLSRRGTASGFEVTARACFYIMAGHIAHHQKIIEKRLA